MKKRILSLLITFCMILPLIGTATVWAADAKMPEMGDVLILQSGDLVTSAVLNDQDELWIYNLSRKYHEQKQMMVYTYNAKSARCLLTGVEAIAGGSRSLYALKHDGSLVNFYVYDGAAVQKGTIMTGVKSIGNLSIYYSMALDKNGNLYTLEGGLTPVDYKVDKKLVESGVSALFDDGVYAKDNALWDFWFENTKKVFSDLPAKVKDYWENNQTEFILTENGDLWGWGQNQVGQLGTTDYDSVGSYFYVGGYSADYTAVRIKKSKPVKILGNVEQVWFDKSQVYARLKDGTLRTWGDGDAIMAMVDATSGSLDIGKWDYPADWPNGKGWSPRKTTVSQWKGLVDNNNAIYKADGTLWIDFSSKGDYVYSGVWSGSVPQPIFSDVPLGVYYDDPVRWAVKEGVTSGTSGTTFSPDQTCTQAQILTFLWRAAGKPAATVENPFSHRDMTAGQYFYQAMLWAWKEGLIDNADLDPNAPCKRSDIVSYLWKLEGSPKANTGSAFADVPQSADFASAVQWAVKQGITSGTSATTFGPYDTCTRGQIVTFLYRSFADK